MGKREGEEEEARRKRRLGGCCIVHNFCAIGGVTVLQRTAMTE